jgi:hypothetical protein
LSGFGKVDHKLAGFSVKNLCPYRNTHEFVSAVLAEPVRAFAVAAAFGLVLRVVSKVKQRVQAFVGFDPDIASDTAVTPGRSAAGNEFFAPERRDAVSTVARFNSYFGAIYKHCFYSKGLKRPGKAAK